MEKLQTRLARGESSKFQQGSSEKEDKNSASAKHLQVDMMKAGTSVSVATIRRALNK